MTEKIRVGLIGCGAISGPYLAMARQFPLLDIAACSDIELSHARARADEFSISRACEVGQILTDPTIEIVLNLTIPKAHAEVTLAAIDAGKHVYVEKPLGINREEGERIVRAARARGVRVGCAPDTFLGVGLQTARKLIDDGAIGRPIGFSAFMLTHGVENWHPNPEFYYEPGGGPMFDMGPYYLTALLNLLGPVKRVMGAATIAIPQRTITSKPRHGQTIQVHTPDHICGTIEFTNRAIGAIMTSFATQFPNYDGEQPITIYGTEGTIRVPDPNNFDGPVHLRTVAGGEWREVAHDFVTGYGRAVGLAEMASALRGGRAHRANLEQAFTVLDLMEGFLDSSASGKAVEPLREYLRPAPMPLNVPFGTFDLQD